MIKTKVRKRYLTSITCVAENVLQFLRRIEIEEIIYMFVGGLLCLSRSFILTATGTIFTYDLLIMNAFLHDKNKDGKRYLTRIICIIQ